MISRNCLRLSKNITNVHSISKRFITVTPQITRVRGVKKPESDYMTSSTGIKYPGNESTLQPAKELLTKEYQLPDATILQSLTHKSFAHAKKPFNEHLVDLGNQFLRVAVCDYALTRPTTNPEAVNNCNFDVDFQVLDTVSSTTVLSEIAKRHKLDTSMFWKNPRPTQPSHRSGQDSVSAQVVKALVGAVYLHHGHDKAVEFVRNRLVNDCLDVSERVFKPKA